MVSMSTIQHCYLAHVNDIGGSVYFTFKEYCDFWLLHKRENKYMLKNRDQDPEECKVVYYPLPYYKDLRALIEIDKGGHIDFREVPIKFLYLII